MGRAPANTLVPVTEHSAHQSVLRFAERSSWAPLVAHRREAVVIKDEAFRRQSRKSGRMRASRRDADFVLVQLARGKDASKSSKKNKDNKDGTASPNASARDSNQSPVLTPSSSTSTLNDIRNKPLPPNNAAHADHAAQVGNAGANAGVDRFPGQPQGANGSTPARHGPLPPTVIISPSAPVRPNHIKPLCRPFEHRTDVAYSRSTYRRPAPLRPCPTISPPRRPARSR